MDNIPRTTPFYTIKLDHRPDDDELDTIEANENAWIQRISKIDQIYTIHMIARSKKKPNEQDNTTV